MTQNHYSSQDNNPTTPPIRMGQTEAWRSKAIQTRNDWFFDRLSHVPNSKLDWVSKGVCVGVMQEFVRLGVPRTQLTFVWYGNVSAYCGLPEKTISIGVGHLVKVRAMVRENKWIPDKKTGEKKRRTLIAFRREFLDDPGSLFEEQEKVNKNRPRIKRHKGCGGEVVNLCTTCGQTHILEDDLYYEDAPEQEGAAPSEEKELLNRLDALIENMAPYYDAAEIDDDVVEAMGGAEKALSATPGEIARYMSIPRHIREGVDDDDMEAVIQALREMRKGK